MFRSKCAHLSDLIICWQFQSLFSWMFRSKLCLVRMSDQIMCFNPCSRGCFARSNWPVVAVTYVEVSILVLVDVSLEDPSGQIYLWMISSFNPCSRGCFARSPPIGQSHEFMSFNPCSRGCFARRIRMPILSVCRLVSILVLVDVSLEEHHERLSRAQSCVSILVLVDVSLEDSEQYPDSEGAMEFQSLFSWMFRSKSIIISKYDTQWSFNPCSRGCFARRLRIG